MDDIFSSFLTTIGSNQTLQIIWKKLVGSGAVEVDSEFGGNDIREKLKRQVTQSGKKTEVIAAYSAASVELANIYENKKQSSAKLLNVCIITISVSLLLLLAGLAISFTQKNVDRIGFITSASGIITTFISGTFFFLYRSENKKLATIEKDIRKMKMLEGYMIIAGEIKNEETLKQAHLKLIKQMEIG